MEGESQGLDWICPLCSQTTSLKRLQSHMRSLHVGAFDNLWICGECEYQSTTFGAIGAHCLILQHSARSVTKRSDGDSRFLASLAKVGVSIIGSGPMWRKDEPLKVQEGGRVGKKVKRKLGASFPRSSSSMSTRSVGEALLTRGSPSPYRPASRARSVFTGSPTKEMGGEDGVAQLKEFLSKASSSCRICQTSIAGKKSGGTVHITASSMRLHVTSQHYDTELYGCRKCNYRSRRDANVNSHARKAHGLAGGRAHYRVLDPKAGPTVWAKMIQAFPLLKAATTSDSIRSTVIAHFANPATS